MRWGAEGAMGEEPYDRTYSSGVTTFHCIVFSS